MDELVVRSSDGAVEFSLSWTEPATGFGAAASTDGRLRVCVRGNPVIGAATAYPDKLVAEVVSVFFPDGQLDPAVAPPASFWLPLGCSARYLPTNCGRSSPQPRACRCDRPESWIR